MPDKWEYPWYAAWDLAFHCVSSPTSTRAAKEQLLLLCASGTCTPTASSRRTSGSSATSTRRCTRSCARGFRSSAGDPDFLVRAFQKLLINFTWWVNRKDTHGNNLFEGGFLGLDNIGVFDRSRRAARGAWSSPTAPPGWLVLPQHAGYRAPARQAGHSYEDLATKFFEHFASIAAAITGSGTRRTASTTTVRMADGGPPCVRLHRRAPPSLRRGEARRGTLAAPVRLPPLRLVHDHKPGLAVPHLTWPRRPPCS